MDASPFSKKTQVSDASKLAALALIKFRQNKQLHDEKQRLKRNARFKKVKKL
jgi:hypothetical protein